MRNPRRFVFSALFPGLLFSVTAAAQPEAITVSNDIHWIAAAVTASDEAARRISLPSTITNLDLGALPANADLTAIERMEDGSVIFVLDTFVNLGGVVAGPEDLIAWNGTVFSLFFDGSTAGLPRGTMIDAVARVTVNDVAGIALSFDIPTVLPGPLTVDDEDLAVWAGAAWSMYFDGSASGIPTHLDLDGFDYDPLDETFYFSFDTSGKISTFNFDDEDVMALDGSSWSLAFDASANLDSTFAAGDLDALFIDAPHFFSDGFESGLLFP